MPDVAARHGSEPAPPAERLAELTAALERTATEVTATVRSPEALPELRTAIRHLELTCAELATASTAMAYRASDAAPGASMSQISPAARAVAWHLHHLSSCFRACRDACAAAGSAAGA
jgi:hypothetical protein